MRYEEAMQGCIFRFRAGSHAYGTSTPESDEDFRGVFLAPLSKAFELFQTSFVGQGSIGQHLRNAYNDIDVGDYGAASERIRQAMATDQGDLNMSVGTVSRPGDVDEELQELRKFLKLAADSNPNIIEYLYVEDGVMHETDTWRNIRAKRGMFLSKKARYTFSGYAVSQLNRIKTHRGYLLDPPKHKPERADYDLPPETKFPKEHMSAALALPQDALAEGIRNYISHEKAYEAKLDHWRSYEKWKRERNPKRRELEDKFGYDSKHASHLVRLIRMAREILAEGIVRVRRPDAEELLAIRNGAWSYERLVEFAEKIDSDLDALYKASALRDKPDHKGISDLYVGICEEFYGMKIGGG
jgi:hypothetical protein